MFLRTYIYTYCYFKKKEHLCRRNTFLCQCDYQNILNLYNNICIIDDNLILELFPDDNFHGSMFKFEISFSIRVQQGHSFTINIIVNLWQFQRCVDENFLTNTKCHNQEINVIK